MITVISMSRKICLANLCLFFALSCSSQSENLYRREIGGLSLKIQDFIFGQDSIFSEGRSSEFAELIIETDSNGIITKIRSFGMETDSIYKIFKKMPPAYFSDWQGPKKMVIIIPFFLFV